MNVDVVVLFYGKMGVVMVVMKRVRLDKYIFIIVGDGGVYVIGFGEIMLVVIRNDNVIFFVMNNNMFVMIGG